MFNQVMTRIFGSRNERLLKVLNRQVGAINALEEKIKAMSDDALAAQTQVFRQRLENGETLDKLLPEAFATVREASVRRLGLRPFDVQLIGGMVLHQGKIAEMKTGEGKTLVATLPVYLNALTGRGVHVVTVNDYLARRDADWMRPVYEALGMTVGVVVPGQTGPAKRAAYAADITYATNNELGFDYLRDNMAFSAEQRVQRTHAFAIVDEVDSILIDEARTPLIISGPVEESPQLYVQIDKLVPHLSRQQDEEGQGDFSLDEKTRQVHLSEEGLAKIEELFTNSGLLKVGESLYHAQNLGLLHHLNAALRAHHLYHRDVEYIVRDGEVVIVDEFTGRTLPGRRWSDGLHQAIEAKEGVPIQRENQTLASITFQNYFRLYEKLAGMTGTADTEAYEFQQIYNLEVVVIPTHRPMIRDDRGDLVYLTKEAKYNAILADIKDCVARGQPVLVGTTAIETSELIAKRLQKEKIAHEVLNAKQHEREAHIVANAGRPGAVTIATNMAGRGTDIVLGGNLNAELAALDPEAGEADRDKVRAAWQKRHDQVIAAGGLHIIGTERHESRRIDNQLRGRSGRQGDPGSSRFYLSLEDNLMRIFATPRMAQMMQRLGMQEDEAIEHRWVTKAIENAQRKVEGHNFDIRKNLLEYDDVANDQRKVIYEMRNDLMVSADIGEAIAGIRSEIFADLIDRYIPPDSIDEQWNIPGLEKNLESDFGIDLPLGRWLESDDKLTGEALRERILHSVEQHYADREAVTGPEVMRHLEKAVFLSVLDQQWKEHLANMDYLRRGIHLRGYAQKQPKQEYKREAFEMFTALLDRIKLDTLKILSRVKVRGEEDVQAVDAKRQSAPAGVSYRHESIQSPFGGPQPATGSGRTSEQPQPPEQPYIRAGRKVGRNEPCPCGSGKKYKQCHGQLT